ncbi:hypothetical protein [Rhizobium sp. Root651]|uniref:hypothetical protein n=1 Tax=Rhizobium sp. Root651 TaxID=1736577 RepID=UPI0007148DD0|nr:hypothetical protein [Rhizobium sp. Root651]KRA65292.1 hypothetical protein ASD85_25395 [Rhizobium sp. Root651]
MLKDRSRMRRPLLRAILLALPNMMNHTARRVPAFAERLRQRDLVAWIGLQDRSLGRIIEIRNGRFSHPPGGARCGCVLSDSISLGEPRLAPSAAADQHGGADA